MGLIEKFCYVSKTNKRKIEEIGHAIVTDLNNLCDSYDIQDFEFKSPDPETDDELFNKLYFGSSFDNENMRLCISRTDSRSKARNILLQTKGRYLMLSDEKGYCKKHSDKFLYYLYSFIKYYYEHGRDDIVKAMQEIYQKQNATYLKLDTYGKNFSGSNKLTTNDKEKDATVELSCPDAIGTYKIVVKDEDNKKVGIVDFGDRVIKFVTNSSIVIVNQDTKEKESSKIKRGNK